MPHIPCALRLTRHFATVIRLNRDKAGQRAVVTVQGMADVNRDLQTRPDAYGLNRASAPTAMAGMDLQTQLSRAYLSGNGAEVERLLALITEANIVLPPKSRNAA